MKWSLLKYHCLPKGCTLPSQSSKGWKKARVFGCWAETRPLVVNGPGGPQKPSYKQGEITPFIGATHVAPFITMVEAHLVTPSCFFFPLFLCLVAHLASRLKRCRHPRNSHSWKLRWGNVWQVFLLHLLGGLYVDPGPKNIGSIQALLASSRILWDLKKICPYFPRFKNLTLIKKDTMFKKLSTLLKKWYHWSLSICLIGITFPPGLTEVKPSHQSTKFSLQWPDHIFEPPFGDSQMVIGFLRGGGVVIPLAVDSLLGGSSQLGYVVNKYG